MIEAMACGTPVIAFNRCSVGEVIEHGVTGFIVESVEEAAEAAKHVDSLDRVRIRAAFEKRFSADAMAMGYEDAYRIVLDMADAVPLAVANGDAPLGAKDRAKIPVSTPIAAEVAA
jgi:hypothetical protein